MKNSIASLCFWSVSVFASLNSFAQFASTAAVTNIDGRSVRVRPSPIVATPDIQQMLLNLQTTAEQLVPALGSFNTTAQLRSVGALAVAPPPSESGVNLGANLSTNVSGRASVNLGANLSQPTGQPATPPQSVAVAPIAPPTISPIVPPAVGAPPSPTGGQNPYGGYASANLQQQLVALQVDLERILPLLSTINNQIHSAAGANAGVGAGVNPLNQPGTIVTPSTNSSAPSSSPF